MHLLACIAVSCGNQAYSRSLQSDRSISTKFLPWLKFKLLGFLGGGSLSALYLLITEGAFLCNFPFEDRWSKNCLQQISDLLKRMKVHFLPLVQWSMIFDTLSAALHGFIILYFVMRIQPSPVISNCCPSNLNFIPLLCCFRNSTAFVKFGIALSTIKLMLGGN